MIYHDDGEIRVERDERGVRQGVVIVATVGAVVLGVFAMAADRPAEYMVLLPIAAVLALVVFSQLRRRQVCIIRADQIGYGSIHGRMWWVQRDQVGSVGIRQHPLLQVLFYGVDGRLVTSAVFGSFSVLEVHEAFESAGIPIR